MEQRLAQATAELIKELYDEEPATDKIIIQKTRNEFKGDFTIVTFPIARFSKKSPEQTANELGEKLAERLEAIAGFNVIKGFLNLELSNDFWLDFVKNERNNADFGLAKDLEVEVPVVIEYSSPNTNKPLHLGHVRNNLIGYSIANILEADGYNTAKVNLVNDRGIHICKSMLAWQKWGEGETPEQAGMKGDHLIGKYYVMFDMAYKQQVNEMTQQGKSEEEAKKNAPLLLEAQELLKKWEAGDNETVALWRKMNDWAYKGFDKTYKRLGVDFDKIYYESDTYLLGRNIVREGLEKGILFKKEDGSVWADFSEEGLDEKLLLRSDGTSVYMTQDLGTAVLRYSDYNPHEMIYVVGNEQIYHFDVLSRLLKKLGYQWYGKVKHLSYGMVELPEGKMKSREGTVVDADDLMEEMITRAKETTQELGKIEGLTAEQAEKLYHTIGMGALKYFILKVDPQKNMTFNPEESIDLNGNTGPFIQYAHARIKSVMRKAKEKGASDEFTTIPSIHPREKVILKRLYDFRIVVKQASKNYSPALIANYAYELVREFNQFYQEVSILSAETPEQVGFRLSLSELTAGVIRNAMGLLGIEVPERM
ncbi:MAG: arginine--tRNA ligase [Bacteroidales bacterium]|nr:arginine--tRNA ligase [Bacteroidales bacterium]MCF8339110.1 arginine--tRNA ligase [Bacteroidales bacterium]